MRKIELFLKVSNYWKTTSDKILKEVNEFNSKERVPISTYNGNLTMGLSYFVLFLVLG